MTITVENDDILAAKLSYSAASAQSSAMKETVTAEDVLVTINDIEI